jgi:hypothetical protein
LTQLLPAGASPADVLSAWAWQWLMSKAPQNAGLDALNQQTAEAQRYMALDPLRPDQTTRL